MRHSGMTPFWSRLRRGRRRREECGREPRRRRTLDELAFSKGHAAASSVEGAPRRWSFHYLAKGGLSVLHGIAGHVRESEETRPRLLVLHTSGSSVVRNDEHFLSGLFDVRLFTVRQSPNRTFAWNLVRLAFWMLRHIWTARGVFFRFADYYAVVPAFFTSLLRKRLWIVLGGYDAHHLPQWNYGVYDTPVRAWCARYAIRRATHLLPVHESLWDGWNRYIDPPVRTGVKSLVTGITAQVHVIHNGFDSAFWRPDPTAVREQRVLVVAGIPSGLSERARVRTMHLKGLSLTLDVAQMVPEFLFSIAGVDRDVLPAGTGCPGNVAFSGFLAPGELRRLCQRTKVYAIPSITEGMPSSLAEAMLCGCVPVGSNVNGIPLLIGDTGVIVDHPDPEPWAVAIRKAMGSDSGPRARERIASHFTMARRFAALRDVMTP